LRLLERDDYRSVKMFQNKSRPMSRSRAMLARS
jgi:hypothetical protein